MRKDARCIIDDDRDGHSGEISSAEEFRLVKVSSAGAAKRDEACATCANKHILRDDGTLEWWDVRADAWSAYCSECWLDSDPDLVQCEECLECEADGATGIVYNAGIGAMGFLCTDCSRAKFDKECCAVCRVCSVSHYAVCGGTRYCLDCYDDWLLSEGQVGECEGSAKRMRTATEGAAAANTARNEKNMALLQEWFPAHCFPSRAQHADLRVRQCGQVRQGLACCTTWPRNEGVRP